MPQRRPPDLTVLRAKLAGHAFELAAIQLQLLLRKANFNPGQLRDAIGRWTSEGGGDDLVHDVARRRGGRREGTPAQEARHDLAAARAREATRRLRELEPTWQGPESVSRTIEGEIAHQLATARAAEARLAEIMPRGFGTYENYVQFGQSLRDGLRSAGHRHVEPMLRGSAVTGENFRTREQFDVGRRSDYDVALVSPTLMQRAIELGIPLRGGGTRTEPIRGARLDELGLGSLRNMLRAGGLGRVAQQHVENCRS